MTFTARIDDDLRQKIISKPSVILDDADVMRALIGANDKTLGDNVIDMRGMAMARLETRLDQLEDTHRTVIAAAYENLAGTNQVHRAILRLLDPGNFESFLTNLGEDVADILRVDAVRLVLESAEAETDPALHKVSDVLCLAAPGFIESYITESAIGLPRVVTLRQMPEGPAAIYQDRAPHIHSEACLLLDLGSDRCPGLLVLGSEDPHMFTPQQGGDLLTFFAGVFERSMQRWLT